MLRFSFLFLLLVLSKPTFPQESFVVLIANPEIGANGNAQNLLEVVDSINQIQQISYVVVLGNITANGLFDEFIWAQEILDGLVTPYSVIGGEKDYLLSEGRGSEISLLWGDDKNYFSDGKLSIVCLNTILHEYPHRKYIETESLDWFAEQTTKNKSSRILTFSYYPISSSENGAKFFEKTGNFKKFSFVSKKDKSTKDKSITEGFYLNRKDGWGYLLITAKRDSLFIKKVLNKEGKKKYKSEVLENIFAPIRLDKSKRPKDNFLHRNELWSLNFNKSTVTSSIFSKGKIFGGFKNGWVVCIDQSGKEKWNYQTNGRIYSSPIIEKNLLVVVTNEGDLLTLNANTGSLVQVIGIGETITSEICVVDIKDDGGTTKAVVVGTANGNLYCYNLYTLEPMWINQSANDGISNRIISSIACADNKVLFQDFNGILYCVSAVNGLLLWYWKPSVKNSNPFFNTDLFVKGNNIYLIDAGGNFRCIDALLGTDKWGIKRIKATGLIRINNKSELILPSSKNKLLNISTKLGKVVNEISLPSNVKNETVSDLLLAGNEMMVGFTNGSVYKIMKRKKPEKLFWQDYAPIVSLSNVNDNCLVTDYDGNFTLLRIFPDNK